MDENRLLEFGQKLHIVVKYYAQNTAITENNMIFCFFSFKKATQAVRYFWEYSMQMLQADSEKCIFMSGIGEK